MRCFPRLEAMPRSRARASMKRVDLGKIYASCQRMNGSSPQDGGQIQAMGNPSSPWLPFVFVLSFLASGFGPASVSAQTWEKLERCRLISSAGNDGDSFRVSHDGKEYIFRLCFVDTPEVTVAYPDRVAAQAGYFQLDEKETLKVGQEAAEFTQELLDGGTFTVFTAWEDAKGESDLPRHYAVVEKGSASLIEALVEAGLARIYGMPARGTGNPVGSSPDRYVDGLRRLERDAQRTKVGGWRNSSRIAPTPPSPSPSPSPPLMVNSLIQPSRPLASAIPSSSGSSSTVNVNTASAAQLETIPGIGPALSSRLIAARPFSGPRDLMRVNGIGEKTVVKLSPYFRFKD
jgi:endonuclease YncB( thermonuclease family)